MGSAPIRSFVISCVTTAPAIDKFSLGVPSKGGVNKWDRAHFFRNGHFLYSKACAGGFHARNVEAEI